MTTKTVKRDGQGAGTCARTLYQSGPGSVETSVAPPNLARQAPQINRPSVDLARLGGADHPPPPPRRRVGADLPRRGGLTVPPSEYWRRTRRGRQGGGAPAEEFSVWSS